MKLATDQVSPKKIAILLRELTRVIDEAVEGEIVELGCYEGGSAVAMQELLRTKDYPKSIWLYDSFEGLPEKTKEDQSPNGQEFKAGVLRASKARLQRHFVKRDLRLPQVKRAWFFELDPEDLPEQVALAFLDGDFYESIIDSLKLVWPKLSKGSVVVVDDYQNAALPGVELAVREWSHDHSFTITKESGLGIIRFE